MLCGRGGFLLLERPVETDGRFTNAGRGGSRAGSGTPQRDSHLLRASCLHQGWRDGVTFLPPKWAASEMRKTMSQHLLWLWTAWRRLQFDLRASQSAASYFILQIFAKSLHTYTAIAFVYETVWEIEMKLMNIYLLPSFRSSVCFRNEPVSSGLCCMGGWGDGVGMGCLSRGRRQ